jgi:hypothetical protein
MKIKLYRLVPIINQAKFKTKRDIIILENKRIKDWFVYNELENTSSIFHEYNYRLKSDDNPRSLFIKPKTYYDKIKLLITYKKYWLQKENNIRYIINLLFLLAALVISYIKL